MALLVRFDPRTSRPSNHTDPEVSGRRPEIARIIVVLPAPLAPSRVTNPSRTNSETPCSASILP